MSEAEKRCGKCGQTFKPKPYFYGGAKLCDSCREEKSDDILAAKKAYDNLGPEDKGNINFARAVNDRLPDPTLHCSECGKKISEGSICSKCWKKIERKSKRQQESTSNRDEKARSKWNDKLGNI